MKESATVPAAAMAEHEQQSEGQLLNRLLEGSSPRSPTYVLATVTCDFTARRGTTELSVKRGDDVYVMFALHGWAFAAHMTPGSHRGYVPLGYCRAVKDFYAASQVDIQGQDGLQQRELPKAAHSDSQVFGEGALSTGLAAQECEIYPPPKEFQSSSSSCCASSDADSVNTTRANSAASCPDSQRPSRGQARAAATKTLGLPSGAELNPSPASNSGSVADITLAYWTRNEPVDFAARSTHRANSHQKHDPIVQPHQHFLLAPLISACPSQDESGIGDSNGSTTSSLDWCWDAPLSPDASTVASDRCTEISAGYAADNSSHRSSSSSTSTSSYSESTHEVAICPCCLCPWPCTNTRLSTCDCLCQGLAYHTQHEPDTFRHPALSNRSTTEHVAAKDEVQRCRECYYDWQCGDNAGGSGRLRFAEGDLFGARPAAVKPVRSEAKRGLLQDVARHRQARDEGYEEHEDEEDDVFTHPVAQQRRPHSRSDGPSPRVTFNLLPTSYAHRKPQAARPPNLFDGQQQKEPIR